MGFWQGVSLLSRWGLWDGCWLGGGRRLEAQLLGSRKEAGREKPRSLWPRVTPAPLPCPPEHVGQDSKGPVNKAQHWDEASANNLPDSFMRKAKEK